MSLPACIVQWPQHVSRQVMLALFTPAQDMHPERARALVPRALWALTSASLSRGLQGLPADWPATLDGSRIDHRLALLPMSVLEQVAWNLGLLLHAPNLRRLVLREEVQALTEQGLQDADWQLALSAPSLAASADRRTPTAAHALPAGTWTEWPQRLRQTGFMALLTLAEHLGPVLGPRLTWKLPLDAQDGVHQADEPSIALLELAYKPAVSNWSTEWDPCLVQLKPLEPFFE